MTEYGRGQGSEPWGPEDPLYGDGGWAGQQAQAAQQSPYGGRPQQHYPQQPQQQYDDGTWSGQDQQGYDQAQQQYPYDQQGYGRQDGYDQQQYDPQHQQQYPAQQHQQQHEHQQHQQHQQHEQHQQQGYDAGGWGAGGQAPVQYPVDPADPYGQQTAAYGTEQPDFYGTPDAYPPPEPPARRRTEPEPERADWDPGPDQGEHAFFAGGDADEDGDDDGAAGAGRGERRGRGSKPRKRRDGCACLVVCLVLGGGVAGVGYFGFQFYQDRFGTAPDFAGDGNGEQVTVTIPKGAGGSVIGQVLKRQGVVKSVDAFIAAIQSNPDGKSIQDGVYTLQKEMSADSAVRLMLSPKSRNNLIIAEGKRNADVYELIDKRLEVDDGTTAKIAESQWKSLGLPDWAMNHPNVKDPLEGFLYPSSYPVAKGQKPKDVLEQMVARAADKYEELGFEKKSKELGLDGPWQLVTVASLVQAEGKTHDDFRKMSEVVYNRLKTSNTETNQLLQFDSTYNYLKKQSDIHISESEINGNKDPYNTYTNRGLPPGPIGNPGDEALQAALNPTDQGWLYFVAVDGVHRTEFARTNDEFEKLKDEFNASSGN